MTAPKTDDWGKPIVDEYIDGKTKWGPWAIMTPESWAKYGCGRLGTGYGQRYRRHPYPLNTSFKKVEG